MQETLLNIVAKANAYLSDYILIILLVGVGLFYSFRTRFVQVRCFGEGMKKVFGGIKFRGAKNSAGGLSSFQALATAIAAQVGTGNIVGASGAILVGGPGAIFWMWIIAFLGMATIYAEAVLAQETRIKGDDGEVHGGPVYYIKKAFPNGFGKFLAGFFSIAAILALGFMGSMVQSNSIAESCNTAFGIPTYIVGIIISVIAAFIFLGGIQRIASVTEKLVPIMAVFFLLGGFVLLVANITQVPSAIGMIFKYAFTPKALVGGGIGAALKIAISQGAKRGLFSNEAGMGSTPHAHAMANVEKPHDQGVVAMVGVFIDTFVVLTMTALVIITCLYNGEGKLAAYTDEKVNEQIVLEVDYYNTKENGEVEKVTKEVETNLYLVATGQADNNTVAELVLNGNITVNDVKATETDKDLTALVADNTIALENDTVKGIFEKYPASMFVNDATYDAIFEITENTNDEKYDNTVSIADAVTIMTNNKSVENIATISKTNAMQTAFSSSFFGSFGSIFVAICLLFFAFSTILSWNFFGKLNVQSMFKNSKIAVLLYSAIAIVFIFMGTLASNNLVWELTDFFNYLMVLPNAIALFALSSLVSKAAKSAKEKKNDKK